MTKFDYFDPTSRVETATERLLSLPRMRTGSEMAKFDVDAVADLIDVDDDWIVLSTRLAQDRRFFISPSGCWSRVRNRTIREAIDRLRVDSPRAPLDIRAIAKASASSEELIRAFFADAPQAPQMVGHMVLDHLDADHVRVVNMSMEAETVGFGPRSYPEVPLNRLYRRAGSPRGSGASGTVVPHELLAHTLWGEPKMRVAVKMTAEFDLIRLHGCVEKGRERLLRGFRAARSHRSSRLCRSYDIFPAILQDPIRASTRYYCEVMELVEGTSLSIDAMSFLNATERLRTCRDLASAVRDFHAIGGVHRDIKPANAILEKDGSVRLVDYGIAKTAVDDNVTGSSEDGLTPRNASPQQVANPSDDHAADDVYALGLTVYELIAGQKPFRDVRLPDLAQRKREGPVDVEALSHAPSVAKFVVRMTAPSREERPTIDKVVDVLASECSA